MILPPLNKTLFPDILEFGKGHIKSKDIDPVYPVLREFYDSLDWNEETRLWFTELYLAYYHLGSAVRAFELFPVPLANVSNVLNAFPTATERRGLRGGKIVTHLTSYTSLVREKGSQKAFIQNGWNTHELYNYEVFWITNQNVWGNGRWSTFKCAELLQQVHNYSIKAPDMRLQFCSGPKDGLCKMFGLRSTTSVSLMNRCAEVLREEFLEHDLYVSWEQLETILCDFNSLCNGHYYVGHDIDQMQEQLSQDSPLVRVFYSARLATLPNEYLGEVNGWSGVDKERKKVYAQVHKVSLRA